MIISIYIISSICKLHAIDFLLEFFKHLNVLFLNSGYMVNTIRVLFNLSLGVVKSQNDVLCNRWRTIIWILHYTYTVLWASNVKRFSFHLCFVLGKVCAPKTSESFSLFIAANWAEKCFKTTLNYRTTTILIELIWLHNRWKVFRVPWPVICRHHKKGPVAADPYRWLCWSISSFSAPTTNWLCLPNCKS